MKWTKTETMKSELSSDPPLAIAPLHPEKENHMQMLWGSTKPPILSCLRPAACLLSFSAKQQSPSLLIELVKILLMLITRFVYPSSRVFYWTRHAQSHKIPVRLFYLSSQRPSGKRVRQTEPCGTGVTRVAAP